MNIQGMLPVNIDQFKNISLSLNGAESLAELQEMATEALDSVKAVEDSIADQLEKINDMKSLLVIPSANLGEIVSWITGVVDNLIGPMVLPALTMEIQIDELTQATEELKSKIDSLKLKFPSLPVNF